jgi:hypothetical protein
MRMPQHRRLPRTINELVRQGPPPKGSLLEAVMKDNPYFGHAPEKREYTKAQERLFDQLVATHADAYGERNPQTVRLGEIVCHRLQHFLTDHPEIDIANVISFAVVRLLDGLGEGKPPPKGSQQRLFDKLVATPASAYGERNRQIVRLGEIVCHRLQHFLTDHPEIDIANVISFANVRLLDDLGE